MALCTAGALIAGGVAIAAVTAVSWVYKYVTGRHPDVSQQLDSTRFRIQDVANGMRCKACDLAGFASSYGGSAGTEAAPGA
ncbi:hypothetical protein GOP47_0002747 [Adiantum capillus-veneris]|uniref:Uncharacterized protein n=1 Tax=Adiantum capillus-veneris TaxID=13818 RepID=A0A9D4ZPG2_ADICA|nr:hypothetical protein GOP47_0002747 [Adiantum capillus-veneris]